MSSLSAALEPLMQQGDAFVIDAPAAWAQGRTLYGGMTAALAYEAVRRTHTELPPLRAAQFTFVGPASGHLRFSATLLRRGRSSTIIASECVNEGGVVARSVFAFGAVRESRVAHNFMPLPPVPSPADCPPFRKSAPSQRGFWDNFETRLASGARLLEQTAPRPEFAVWTRFLDVGGADATTALLAMSDCLPPAAMVHFPQAAPISTMTWGIDIAHIPPASDDWCLLWSNSEQAGEGYSMQNMAMWGAQGEPVAVGRQAVAIFA